MTATTRGRPKTPLDLRISNELRRIADLAAATFTVLREPRRHGRYSSELQLREFLADAGVKYTSAHLNVALDLLSNVGFLRRAPASSNASRSGWLSPTIEWSSTSPVNGDE